MFYLGENTIKLIASLLEEIDYKKEMINDKYNKLYNLLKIKKLLTKSSTIYIKERNDVLEYLNNNNEIDPHQFNYLLRTIRELNSHSFYRGIDDDLIYASYSDYTDLFDYKKDIMELCIFKNKDSNTSLFTIPIISETSKISSDKEFIDRLVSVNSQYMYFSKLKEYIDKCSLLKIKLKDRFSSSEEKIHYEQELKRYSSEMRTLKDETKKFFKENKDIEERILRGKPNKKLNWIDVINYSIIFYRNVYIKEVLEDAYNELLIKNNNSKIYCEKVLESLDNSINSIKNDIFNLSNNFKQEYILNYVDSIYPGIKNNLIDSLYNNNKIEQLKIVILNTIYLEDIEYEEIKYL